MPPLNICIHRCGFQASPYRIMRPSCGLKLGSPAFRDLILCIPEYDEDSR